MTWSPRVQATADAMPGAAVKAALLAALRRNEIGGLERRLSGRGIPPTVVTAAEKQQIDAALNASSTLVDAIDEQGANAGAEELPAA